MNKISLSVAEVLKKKEESIGKKLTVMGQLIVSPDISYLMEPGDQPDSSSQKIVILQDGFIEQCMSQVPCLVGGLYYYYDLAEIEGTITPSEFNDFKLGLLYLKTVKIFRNNSQFTYLIHF